jgi:hypothetical protein
MAVSGGLSGEGELQIDKGVMHYFRIISTSLGVSATSVDLRTEIFLFLSFSAHHFEAT